MREAAKTSATIAGACTFMAQVSAGLPEAPNFMAAMKTTLGSFGRASTAWRSSRSQAMVSMPAFFRPARTAGSAIEIGVGAGEIRLLAFGRERHAVDKVVAVALDMAEPQQRDQRQVLLHADAGQGRQVLRRHEIPVSADLGVELGDARGV